MQSHSFVLEFPHLYDFLPAAPIEALGVSQNDEEQEFSEKEFSSGESGNENNEFVGSTLVWQVVHQERVVHGDLKPANFLMVKKDLKLIDFGIAKRIESDNTTNIVRENAVLYHTCVHDIYGNPQRHSRSWARASKFFFFLSYSQQIWCKLFF